MKCLHKVDNVMTRSFVSWEVDFPQLSLNVSNVINGRVRSSGKTFAKAVLN